MIGLGRQARNLFLLTLAGLMLSSHGWAMETYVPKTQRNVGAKGAGGNKVMSVGDVFDSIGHSLSSMFPDAAEEAPEAVSTAKKPDAQAQALPKADINSGKPIIPKDDIKSVELPPVESGVIKAKRLDATTDKDQAGTAAQIKEQAPPPPPYKVYSAPKMIDEPREASAGEEKPIVIEGAAPASARDDDMRAVHKPLVENTKAPPPVFDRIRDERDVGEIVINPPPRKYGKTQAESGGNMPPTTALPKQFFPIFPMNATDDAQAQLLPVASNREIEADHSDTTRALISIHDIQRNSVEAVASLMTLQGADNEPTLILAPHFALDIDVARFAKHLPNDGQQVARWTFDDPWPYGGESNLTQRQLGISSFTAMDILLLFLSDKQRFPSLQQIVIVGHGVGADFVQRYAALGQAPDVLAKQRLPVRFVVANPSSYLYLTNVRPLDNGARLGAPDAKACPKVNSYPFGLNELPPYAKKIGANAIRMRFPERNVVTLVGGKIATDNFLDRNCEAAAQGKDRLARAKGHARYVTQSFGEVAEGHHSLTIVPNAGFDPIATLGSACGMELLFGQGRCRGE